MGDDARLHHYMSFLLPDSGTKRLGDTLGFPNFVFRELHMRGRFKKLMALPDAFDQQLLAYLKMNPDESEPACDMLHCQLWKVGNWLEAAEHQKRLASISSTLKARRKYLVYAQASLRALKQPDAAHLAQYSNANTLMSDIDLHLEVLDMQLGLGGDENQPPMPLGELAKGRRFSNRTSQPCPVGPFRPSSTLSLSEMARRPQSRGSGFKSCSTEPPKTDLYHSILFFGV